MRRPAGRSRSDTTAAVRARASAAINVDRLAVATFYLGLSVNLREWVDPLVWRFRLSFIVASVLALVGWRRMILTRSMRHYLRWVVPLCLAVAFSTVVAWDRVPFFFGRMFILWLAFIVPGLASLLREERLRDLFIGGLAIGAAVFGFAALWRVVSGASVFDAGTDKYFPRLLGVGRNAAMGRVVIVVPFLVADKVWRPLSRFRWILLALSVNWIVFSGGRSGLLALASVGIVYALIQPGASRRIRTMWGALAGATAILILIFATAGQAATSLERLLRFVDSEPGRTEEPPDEIRRLLHKKAWHLADEHPWFGIGPGRFAGTYHRVVDEGSTGEVRNYVINEEDHNAFAGLMAEAGFPSLVFFVILVTTLLARGVAHRKDASARAATSAFAGVVVLLVFGLNRLEPVLFVPTALLLAIVSAREHHEIRTGEAQQGIADPAAGLTVR